MARSGVTEDDVLRLSFIGGIARRNWRLLAALAVLGGLLGFGASPLLSPGYVAVSKVLLQDVADEEELLTEVQIAMSQVVLDRTADGLGWVSGADLRGAVTAEVLEGNVIRVTGTADTQERAVQLTDRATAEYVAFSDRLLNDAASAGSAVLQDRRDSVVDRIRTIRERIDELQGSPLVGATTVEGALARSELDQLNGSLNDANAELDDIDGREAENVAENQAGRAAIGVLEPAVPGGAASPTMVQLIAAGALLLPLLGLFALIAVSRTDRRLRDADEIGAALGAPVLARVGVRTGPDAERPAVRRAPLARLKDLLRDDAAWVPGPTGTDPTAESLRYRRALTRLRRGPDESTRLLLLVPADDAPAHRAVAALATAAAGGGDPVTVVTDDPDLAAATRAAASRTPGADTVVVRDTVQADAPGVGVELAVADVDLARPTVLESVRVRGAVVVVSVGTRTAWELVGLTEACADAGLGVLGVVVVSPRPPAREEADGPDERPDRPDEPADQEPADQESGDRKSGDQEHPDREDDVPTEAPEGVTKAHTNGSMMAGSA